MLLTSSQVSIAASSSVVLVFTSALFLSGYAIQQRTLRDLREAIKPSPRPKPQIFLPDRFRTSTTELADGTVVVVDVDPGRPEAYRPPRRPEREQVVVEVRPTVAGDEAEDVRDAGRDRLDDAVEVLREGRHGGESLPDDGEKERDGLKAEEGGTKTQKKLGRAERRRRIKEEIQRLAQGDKRGVYQPRLW
ncbi:hypothetical protein CONLIGDRAFT_631000 [Coniochaeta ligniaria NRRL 30616]|uniref:Transmembrane protein n=1 Tax=Coniochaeta ligniaria NRRL 30616 TaxID=1408157 RepID=A0A1J7IUC8_9PEZI|nr:hypothetical protein CONLIGDRAFT_631000 [Coniochaeta ligniaria NRRL 30616]